MKPTTFALCIVIILIGARMAFSQTGLLWERLYDGPAGFGSAVEAIALDSSGNVIVAGRSKASNGKNDFMTIKYSSNGDTVFTARYNGPGNDDDGDYVSTTVVAKNGDILVTGTTRYGIGQLVTIRYHPNGDTAWTNILSYGVYDFPEGIAVDSAGNAYVTGVSYLGSGADMITIKYDTAGNRLWEARFDGPAGLGDQGMAIAVDDSGYVYVGGAAQWDSTKLDFCTIKYTPTGDTVWTARYDGTAYKQDCIYGLKIDDSGNVYVTGSSQNPSSQYSDVSQDIVTIKYNSAGKQQWLQRFNGVDNFQDLPYSITLDKNHNVFVTGFCNRVGSYHDIVTIKYRSDGTQEWVRYAGGTSTDEGRAIAVDTTGKVYVTGLSYSSVSTSFDILTLCYSNAGDSLWSYRYNSGGTQYDEPCGIVVDKNGSVYVAGYSTPPSGWVFTTIKLGVSPSAADDIPESVPSNWALKQNYPNPFNPVTAIDYYLARRSHVIIEIYNVLGQRIRVLADETESAGSHHVEWNGSDDMGKQVASGIYFYQLSFAGGRQTRKMVLLK